MKSLMALSLLIRGQKKCKRSVPQGAPTTDDELGRSLAPPEQITKWLSG